MYFSIDKGKTWSSIAEQISIDDTFLWNVPTIEKSSNRCRMIIEIAGNESIYDQTKKNFSIRVLNSSINITNSIGNERFTGGDTLKVTWKSKDVSEQGLMLSYSIDNKAKWKKIKSNLSTKGSYYWIIPRLNKIYKNYCIL